MDAYPALSVGLGADAAHFTLHPVYGFLFQNPARIRINSESRQGSEIVVQSYVLFMLPAVLPDLVLQCLPTVSSDHRLSLLSGL